MNDLTSVLAWLGSAPDWVYYLIPLWLVIYTAIGILVLIYLAWKEVSLPYEAFDGITLIFLCQIWPILLPYGIIRILIC